VTFGLNKFKIFSIKY